MKASEGSSGGGRRVFTWWGRLHIWHVCVQTEGPSNTPSAGAKFWSLDEGKINEDRCLVIQRNDHKQTVIKKKMKPLSKSFRKKCIIFYVTYTQNVFFTKPLNCFSLWSLILKTYKVTQLGLNLTPWPLSSSAQWKMIKSSHIKEYRISTALDTETLKHSSCTGIITFILYQRDPVHSLWLFSPSHCGKSCPACQANKKGS